MAIYKLNLTIVHERRVMTVAYRTSPSTVANGTYIYITLDIPYPLVPLATKSYSFIRFTVSRKCLVYSTAYLPYPRPNVTPLTVLPLQRKIPSASVASEELSEAVSNRLLYRNLREIKSLVDCSNW